jgi:hypothetical protein
MDKKANGCSNMAETVRISEQFGGKYLQLTFEQGLIDCVAKF